MPKDDSRHLETYERLAERYERIGDVYTGLSQIYRALLDLGVDESDKTFQLLEEVERRIRKSFFSGKTHEDERSSEEITDDILRELLSTVEEGEEFTIIDLRMRSSLFGPMDGRKISHLIRRYCSVVGRKGNHNVYRLSKKTSKKMESGEYTPEIPDNEKILSELVRTVSEIGNQPFTVRDIVAHSPFFGRFGGQKVYNLIKPFCEPIGYEGVVRTYRLREEYAPNKQEVHEESVTEELSQSEDKKLKLDEGEIKNVLEEVAKRLGSRFIKDYDLAAMCAKSFGLSEDEFLEIMNYATKNPDLTKRLIGEIICYSEATGEYYVRRRGPESENGFFTDNNGSDTTVTDARGILHDEETMGIVALEILEALKTGICNVVDLYAFLGDLGLEKDEIVEVLEYLNEHPEKSKKLTDGYVIKYDPTLGICQLEGIHVERPNKDVVGHETLQHYVEISLLLGPGDEPNYFKEHGEDITPRNIPEDIINALMNVEEFGRIISDDSEVSELSAVIAYVEREDHYFVEIYRATSLGDIRRVRLLKRGSETYASADQIDNSVIIIRSLRNADKIVAVTDEESIRKLEKLQRELFGGVTYASFFSEEEWARIFGNASGIERVRAGVHLSSDGTKENIAELAYYIGLEHGRIIEGYLNTLLSNGSVIFLNGKYYPAPWYKTTSVDKKGKRRVISNFFHGQRRNFEGREAREVIEFLTSLSDKDPFVPGEDKILVANVSGTSFKLPRVNEAAEEGNIDIFGVVGDELIQFFRLRRFRYPEKIGIEGQLVLPPRMKVSEAKELVPLKKEEFEEILHYLNWKWVI